MSQSGHSRTNHRALTPGRLPLRSESGQSTAVLQLARSATIRHWLPSTRCQVGVELIREHKTGLLLTSAKLARLELWGDLLCSLYEFGSFNPVASIQ